MGEGGVLHTDSEKFSNTSSYVGEGGAAARENLFSESSIMADLIDAQAYALVREREFYHLYTDANTYEEFLAEIRKIFAGAGNDAKYIRNLSNLNLSKFIPEGWNQKDAGKAAIRIQEEFLPGEIDLSMFNSINTSIEPNELYITVTKESAPAVKKFLMKLLMEGAKDPDKYWTATPGYTKGQVDFPGVSRWSKKTDKKKALHNYMSQIIEENKSSLLEKAGVKFEVTKGKLTVEDLEDEIVPFTQYTLTSARDALKNPETKAILQRVLAKIRDFILNDCLHVSEGFVYDNGRGNVLEKAAYSAWASLEGEILAGVASHFFEGMNLAKGLLGAGGEFQMKLINNYLALVSGNNALAEIIGGIVKDGRAEPRTDVQIISALGGDMGSVVAGIQVKNVNENTASALSVSSDLELIAPNLPEGLRDVFANSMFNSDIDSAVGDSQDLLENYLTNYFWRALNLHVGKGLNPNHTNTFYFVGGSNLVPASVMIDRMVGSGGTLSPKFTIGSLTKPEHGDEYFASRDGGDKSGNPPHFVEYWKAGRYLGWGQGAEDFSETGENESLYNSLLKGVSVNAEINMTGIISSYVDFKGSMDIFPH